MRKTAFTLVEVLVVITILSLLMAIMLPAMGKAREQGRRTLCMSNLRQMVLAAQTYTQTNDEYYPVAHYRKKTDTAKFEYCWDFTTIQDRKTGEVKVVSGLLWQGQEVEKIQQCPSFKGDSNTKHDPYTGYNYNTSYIGHGEGESIETPAKVNQVRKPDKCALFGDGQWRGGANKFMRAPLPWDGDKDNSLKAAGTQGYRHNKMTNVGWCDGHISSQKDFYTDTVKTEKQKIEQHNKTNDVKIGFLSPDNGAYDLD
jgi:prepilin-type N-terminal cleavage/methylation domain-containing protein/prepilin-type processing-associated H-X9-DG protein